MTIISGSISSTSQAPASLQKLSADGSAQTTTNTGASASTSASKLVTTASASYSDAGRAIVSSLLNQQDSATSASADFRHFNLGLVAKIRSGHVRIWRRLVKFID